MDKGLAEWTRAWRDGQGLGEMDKDLARRTRAWQNGQGLVEMDKGEAYKGMTEATRA